MQIKVFKFGGASVNNPSGVRNVAAILKRYVNQPLVVVVSAMGKTTNALEEVLNHYLTRDPIPMIEAFERIRDYHSAILHELFPEPDHPVFGEVGSLFDQLRGTIRKGHLFNNESIDYNFEYDQIVSFGELISSAIIHHYLLRAGIPAYQVDARELIRTDGSYREARVDWEITEPVIRERLSGLLAGHDGKGGIVLTQGFIAGGPDGNTTTLGREGSDYSAAIFAHALRADEMTIWKDVPGVMNADPKWLKNARKIDLLSFREAIELAYFGASVIHPKTIKPLENANIILYVKSFRKPDLAGTVIRNMDSWKISVPIYIRKQNQVLISVSPRDFSFIVEENLSNIFMILAKHRVKVNVMQNSAISFSICIDGFPVETHQSVETHRGASPHRGASLPKIITELRKDYMVRYNENVELYTIRHYNQRAINRITKNKTVLLEQKTRGTVHLILGMI